MPPWNTLELPNRLIDLSSNSLQLCGSKAERPIIPYSYGVSDPSALLSCSCDVITRKVDYKWHPKIRDEIMFELASGNAFITPVATFSIWVILWSFNSWKLWAPSWEEIYRPSTTWWILSSGLVSTQNPCVWPMLTWSSSSSAKLCFKNCE